MTTRIGNAVLIALAAALRTLQTRIRGAGRDANYHEQYAVFAALSNTGDRLIRLLRTFLLLIGYGKFGQATITQTMDTYCHVMPDMQNIVTEVLESMFSEKTTP